MAPNDDGMQTRVENLPPIARQLPAPAGEDLERRRVREDAVDVSKERPGPDAPERSEDSGQKGSPEREAPSHVLVDLLCGTYYEHVPRVVYENGPQNL